MYPNELIITKSLTIEKLKRWEKTEFTVKILLNPEDSIETAKGYYSILIDAWLDRMK
jgi:hypothetical protein